jgi:Leucine-rich repeat (LRR) protein
MKKTLVLLAVVLVCNWSQSQIVNIPDAYLKSKLIGHFPVIDTNGDGEIQVSEALATTTLYACCALSEDPTGLEAFINVTQLDVSNNNFTNFDVSVYPNLETLNINGNYVLLSLDVSMLSNLVTLNARGCNALSSFTFSGANNLQTIDVNYSYLSSLDITSLPNLTTLDCSYSKLTSLTVNGSSTLTHLNCSYNALSSINLSGLPNLEVLDISEQEYNYDPSLTALDVSALTSLTSLSCHTNIISVLDVSNLVNLTTLNCYRNLIEVLDVDNLTQLTTLSCYDNQIPTLNLTPLTNLTHLSCASNYLAPVDLSTLTNLTYLDCSRIPFVNLDVSHMSNLTSLYVSYCELTTLDVSNLSNLIEFYCNFNELTLLDVSTLVSLERLNSSNNQLTELDVSNLNRLHIIDVSSNLFTSLDFSNYIAPSTGLADSGNYFFNNNPNLVYVNLKNDTFSLSLSTYNLNNLNYVCANESQIQYINNHFFLNGQNNVQVNSYCSFSPSGVYNTIMGTVTLDITNNGCDLSDYNPANFKIQLFDGVVTGASFTSNTGEYLFYTQAGNYQITPQLSNPYFTVTPSTTQLTFPSVDGSTQVQDICITPNGIHNDVGITILALTPPVPGFDVNYRVVYKNNGNQVMSGTVNFTFDDAVLDFISATPTQSSQSIGNLLWNYSNLLPLESRSIDITLNLNGPMETPAVNINDALYSNASISATPSDENEEDNFFSLNQIVVGSYDPNDKTCLEGETITPSQVGDYLHYLIRFQNSGTAPAANVVVKDMIDTTKFDMTSLQLITASHEHITRITNNKVEFIFENIQLPAEQDDEPESHGFVAFKIKTKPNLVLGNTVSNTANIYFDYNFPIITNTTSTTVSNLGVNEFENLSVAMTPNPVKDLLTIAADDVITSVLMYDVQGRLIATQVNNSTSTTVDMSQQNGGVYFVKVLTEKGASVEKIIKK